jgi:hypothetical protein
MERKESQSIGDILRLAFQENCMQDRLDERRAVEMWGNVVGTALAVQCRRPDVANGVMTVGVANAALRHELTMSRTKLLNEINRQLGKDVISNIRFVSY